MTLSQIIIFFGNLNAKVLKQIFRKKTARIDRQYKRPQFMTKALNIAVLRYFRMKQPIGLSFHSVPELPKSYISFSLKEVVLAIIILLSSNYFAQAATRTASSSGNWTATATWGGSAIPTINDVVIINNGINVTVNTAAVCSSFTLNGGATGNTVTISGTNSLTVTNGVSIGAGTGIDNKILAVGAGTLSCSSITVTAAGSTNRWSGVSISSGTVNVTGSITMNDTNDDITFTGAGTLNVGGSMSGGTFTSSTGTVNYNGAVAQTLGNYAYYNLTLSGSGINTATAVTVNGTLSMEGTATISAAPTYGGSATLQYNTTSARTAGVEWVATFSGSGGIIIDNTGAITMNSAKILDCGVPLTINNTSTLLTNNYDLTLGGDFINNGTFTAGSSNIIINCTGTQNIAGFVTSGTVSMMKTGGTATFTGNVNGSQLIINGTGGTLNLGAGLTHTFTGNWTRTNGTLNGGSSLLKIGGIVSGTGGTFTAGTGTVEWYAAGAQTLAGVTYNNLTLSGGGAKTTTGAAVNGIFSIEGTTTTAGTAPTYGAAATLQYKGSALQTTGIEFPATFTGSGGVIINNASGVNLGGSKTITNGLTLTSGTFAVGSNTLTLNGPAIAGTPSNLSTTSNSSLVFGGSSSGAIIPSSIIALNNLTINNANGVTLNCSPTLSGALTLSSGALNLNALTLTIGATGSYTCGSGSINGNALSSFIINGSTATYLPPGTYQNLTINRNLGVTMCGNTIVNGALTLNNGDFTVAGNTLTLNGPTISGSPGNLMTNATSSMVFGGSSAGVILPSNVATLLNLTINNSNGISLSGTLSIVGILNLTLGNLNTTATNLLTINNTVAGSIVSASASSFVNGPLARKLAANIAVNGTSYNFPVGDGADFRPFDLINIRTGATTPVMQVTENSSGATTEDGTTMFSISPRNWRLQTISGNFTSAFVQLTDGGIDFTKNVGQSSAQVGPYSSVGGTNIGVSITSGQAVTSNSYFAIGIATIKTYYTYQSGDWKSSSTWTRDPSGSFWINAGVPTSLDNVVILNGRTATIFENGKFCATLEVRLGGTLDLATYNGHNFGTVSGQGLIKLSSSSFPAGDFTSFVAAGAGTVEYYDLNNTGISNTQLTYNNLIVSNYTTFARTVYLNNSSNPINYTLNGNFDLKNVSTGSLTFSFGNSAASDNLINMTVYGNFTVAAGCNVRVNNFATSHALPNPSNSTSVFPVHTLNIYGDFSNNGSVRFTGLPSPMANAYYLLTTTATGGTNYGDVQVFFKGGTDNTLTCNGVTDFFRLIVEKGVDQSNVLEVVSANTSNFALYGPNYQGNNTFNGGTDGYGWGTYYKALFIHYGTLKLNTNISIPSLTEGGQDFNLIPTACLWLNGATVSTTVTGVNGTGYQAATLYGKLRLTSGSFSTGDAAGIVLGTLGTPEMLIEGTGILDVSQAWVATAGANLMSYTQTGGTANFRMQGENHAGPMLGLNSSNTVFTMTGGVLNFTDNAFIGGGNSYQIMDIQAQQGNYQVTGGTVNLNLPGAGTTYTANSTVPFYNMNISRNGGATTSIQWNAPGGDLTILNDLSIGANTVLNLNTSTINLTVGHNFNLPAGATYTPGNNTTTFNGTGGQVFTNAGTITTGLNNFILSNGSNTDISNALTVVGALTINSSCFLNDLGSVISVGGNVTNNGIHNSQANGRILLNGAGAQTIGGSGTGVFGNFGVNKASGTAVFTSNQSITGNLRLVTGILNIGIYNLSLSATSNIYDVLVGTPAPTTFGNAKMITTSGQQSDGGLTKTYGAIGSFLFPLGSGAAYHPATIAFAQAPATWGDITIKPVALVHPFVTTGNSGAMKYYWKVISNGITGIQPGSVSHTYQYVSPADVVGIENNYITGLYNPYTWTGGATAQVDKIAKKLLFPSINNVDGDYTGGVPAAFGIITVFYSRTNGNWNAAATWSTDPVLKHTGAAAAILPTSDDAVVIGDGGSINHVVTVIANGAVSGGLQINLGSTIDLQTFTGHNFGALPDLKISGSGTMRISSSTALAVFPSGDFGNFLGPNGGTVEYYTQSAPSPNIGVAFTLPTQYTAGVTVNISTYANLILSPGTGRNITLPNTDLTIFKDLNTNTSLTSVAGITQLNNTGSTRTVTVNGNLNVNKGNLQFTNGGSLAQNLTVNGNVTVASGAIFDIAAALAATNTLTINGDLINNGSFNMLASATRLCNVTFTGAANNGIKGTTATRTDFNILTVDKGVNRNSILEATINAFSLNTTLPASLTLTNGTFRLSTPLTITLTTNSPFTIPTSGCLSANIGTINIGGAFNAGDLLLQGRLEVLNTGVVNIGISGNNINNDIEYAAAGNPEINVSGGGTLNVKGQIRRNTSNTLGSLWFNQSGGTILVRGRNLNNTRGVFEILNSGSQFNTSGGSLIIENAGSVSFSDIYIDPANSTVNGSNGGHTLIIGDGSTPINQTFKLNSSASLWNLTIDGTTNNKTAILQVNNLTILNNLSINSNGASGSVFQANDQDVTIGGSLFNNNLSSLAGINAGGYQASASAVTNTQITNFTGTGQINGTVGNLTNFANLLIGSSGTTPVVTLGTNSNLRINRHLTLASGTLSDAGNTITVLGDIANFAAHTSPATPGGGIILTNSVKQIISGSGNGRFGNLTINNGTEVSMIDDTRITGQLNLSGGSLYIDDYLLIMDANASFAGTFDAFHMIMGNGVMSDKGVQKLFSGSVSNFVIPIGTNGKYRPATFSLTSPSSGAIKVTPVSQANPADLGPTNDQLNYYWITAISGFSGLTASTQVYQYGGAEVTGNESNYHGVLYSNASWSDYGTGSINTGAHTITVTRSDLLGGEYTAGEMANFVDKPKLYSAGTGLWTNGSNWSVNPSGTPAYGSYPNGNPVVIQVGHVITMDMNSALTYSLDLQGTLDLQTSAFHNLGYITDTIHTGTGLLRLQATVPGIFLFPGGNYDRFMASPHTTVELYGSNNATMSLKPGNIYKPYQNLLLSGTGIKYMSADNLKVLGNLTISNTSQLNNTLFNKDVFIWGNWIDMNSSPSSGGFVPGTGHVSFEGGAAQTLTVTNGGISENFYNFKINNTNGLMLTGGGNVIVSNILYLQTGNITTNSTNSFTLSNSSPTIVSGGSVNSFVNGPLRKQINAGSYFTFPVGKSGTPSRYGNVYLSSVAGAGIWEAEYYNGDPTLNSPPMDKTSTLLPIDQVSSNEYWRVNGAVAGSSAKVTLRWDAISGYAGTSASTRSKIRQVKWNGTQWAYTGKVLNDGGPTSGTVTTDNSIGLSSAVSPHWLTIGNEGLPTAVITSPLTASICNNGVATTTVTVALTGAAPWALSYKLGTVTTTLTNIASTPVSIILTSDSPGITQPITVNTNFDFNITNVNDLNGIAGISDYVTKIVLTVKPISDNTITGRTMVGTNEANIPYSTPADASAYLWSLPSGGGVITNPTAYNPTITWGAATGSFLLNLTKTSAGGCIVTNSKTIQISASPTPVISGSQYVCAGSTGNVYSTPNVAGHTYAWAIVPGGAGTITAGAGTSSITVTWNGAASGNSLTLDEGSPGIHTIATPLPVDIGIQPSASSPSYTYPASVCNGSTAAVTVNNSEVGVRYQIRLNSNSSYVGAGVNGTGGSIVLTTTAISANTTYNVYAYTLAPFNCAAQLTNPSSTFTVNALAALNYGTLTSADQTICFGSTPNSITFATAPSGGSGTFTYQWYSYTGLAGACPSGTAVPAGWSSIGGATSGSYAPPSLNASMSYAVMVTPSGACGTATWASGCRQVTVNANLTAGTVGSVQTICYNTAPAALTQTAAASGGTGVYTYQWQNSPDNSTFVDIAGATGIGYSPGALIATTYYRRKVTSGSCGTVNSASVMITVNPNLTAGTIGAAQTLCYNTTPAALTQTAVATGGTGVYTYQWQNSPDNIAFADIAGATSSGFSPGALTATTYYKRKVTSGSCGTVSSASVMITVNADLTAGAIGDDEIICANTSPAGLTEIAAATGGTGAFTYQWQNSADNISFTNISGANSTGYSPGVLTATTYFRRNVTSGTCGPVSSGSMMTTVNPAATANAGTAITACSNVGSVNVTPGSSASNATGITWSSTNGTGTFANANSLTTCTYTLSVADIAAGSINLTLTAAGNAPCGNAVSTKTLTIKLDGSWIGGGSDWNTPGNWDCNTVPTSTTHVVIANGKTPYPILSATGTTKNLTIGSTATVDVSNNTLQIAGTINISSVGPVMASSGAIEMTGAAAQTIPANTFAVNNLKNLTLSNAAGVNLSGTLNITGILKAATGNLSTGGFLTLISSAAKTALIDGSGAGQVTGNVTMQRYLPSGFGYKYVSSPFQAATVSEFSPEVDLSPLIFPTFYKYDENNSTGGLYISGWVKYITPTDPLIPITGYAANFGSNPAPKSVDVTGVVNNGNQSIGLSNNNRPFTKGFNLVGNPYPSPIDWDYSLAGGWTRTNVDNAIYLFNALFDPLDQYGGKYSSYVNGIQSDTINITTTPNIIPSMQGFFVHVTNPGAGSLAMTNKVRTSDLSPIYKSATVDPRPILRFATGFDEKNSIYDSFVLYFEPTATLEFDKEKDALKLMNTALTIPNLYSITPDVKQLSINGMPLPIDSLTKIPLGVKLLKNGWVNFSARDISRLPNGLHLYLLDKEKNIAQDLSKNPTYRFYLQTGEYNQRFMLIFSKNEVYFEPVHKSDLFIITRMNGTVLVKANLPDNETGKLYVSNMLGQVFMEKEVTNQESVDISSGVNSGIYVVTMTAGVRKQSEKTLIMKK